MGKIKNSSIKVNIAYQIVYRILTIITPLITSPYLSRVLGVEALGKSSSSQALAAIFALFCLLGNETYGTRSIARARENVTERTRVFCGIYMVQLISSLIVVIAYIVFIAVIVSEDMKIIYLFQGLWIIASMLDINWFYFGTEQFKLTVVRNTIIKIISIVLIIMFVKTPDDLWKYILIMSGSMVASQIVLWVYIPKNIVKFSLDFSEAKKHLRGILILFVPVLAMSVFHLMDKTMLNFLSDDTNSGYYYNADKLINIPLGIITALSTVLLPRITNTVHTKGKKDAAVLLKKSSELSMFLTCSISFGIGAISESFVPLFFGNGYEPCILLIKWFIPVLVIKALSNFSRAQYLIPNGKDKVFIIAVILGACVNLVSNVFLIQQYQALGAVIGTLLAETVVLLYQIYSVRSEFNFFILFLNHAIYIPFSVFMYFVVLMVGRINIASDIVKLILQLLIGIVSYMIPCVIYWIIKKDSIFHVYIFKVLNNRR